MNTKLFVRKVAAWSLYHGGITKHLHQRSDREGIILAYHRILPRRSSDIQWIQPGMYVAEDTFEKQMRYLALNYKVIHLDEIKEMRDLAHVCVITFDDGWEDNYTYAYPVLKRYRLPATIFITTNLIGSSLWPWQDRISYYIHNIDDWMFPDLIDTIYNVSGMEEIFFLRNSRNRHEFAEKLISHMKNFGYDKLCLTMDIVDRNMYELKAKLQEKRPWLTWEEVDEMSDWFSFGSHTHNHAILTSVPIKIVQQELETSRRVLFERVRKSVPSFCYPNGDYNDDILRELRNTGYDLAVTTRPGTIHGSKSPLELNRLMIHEDKSSTIPLFACWLANNIPFFP